MEYNDIKIAEPGGHSLFLDLTVPDGIENPPLVIWIHGGGWRQGSYKNNRVPWIAEQGFALASIGYRLTDKAVFPAQIHDCKGAVRWLRVHAEEYGYNAERIVAAGSSAGAHLAMLLGTSAGVSELEGDVGGNIDQSSAVQAVVNYWGPTDFARRVELQPDADTPERGCWALFNGAELGHMDMDLARLGSPVTHLSAQSPPVISFHGEADTIVPPDQVTWWHAACRKTGVDSDLHLVAGQPHSAQPLLEGPYRELAVAFIKKHLL